jgi:plasmid stability protein
MGTMVQIRNVPDALHRRLKSRAALAGMSLSEYLLSEIRQVAERPMLDELRALAQPRGNGAFNTTGRRGSCRARPRVIVVDASAMLDALLRTIGRVICLC